MSTMGARGMVLLAGLCSLAGCDGVATGPRGFVIVEVEATPTNVTVGDTVRLLGTAFNAGPATLRPGIGCAPGVGFYLTDDGGDTDWLYDGVAFICPILDSQEIRVGERDSVWFAWVPQSLGVFEMRAALDFVDGPRFQSDAVEVTVR